MIPSNSLAMTIAAVLALALISGCASSADVPPGSTGYGSVDQIEGDPDRMVCKRQGDTGSRLPKKVCKTAHEWEQERLENQEAIRNAPRSGMRPEDLPSAGGG
jgi:opacity protein-like surface antigen